MIDAPASAPGPDTALMSAERMALLQEALGQLEETCREIIELRYFGDLSYEEISRWQMIAPTSKAFGRTVVWSHPAFAQQCVFARNDRELICVSLAK